MLRNAMSQENLEIMRRNFEALAEGDVGALFEGCDPEIRVFPRPEPDAAPECKGLDGLMVYDSHAEALAVVGLSK